MDRLKVKTKNIKQHILPPNEESINQRKSLIKYAKEEKEKEKEKE